MNALRHLEEGGKATISTLVAIIQALGRESWLESLSPYTSINPLDKNQHRKRARRISPKLKRDLEHKRKTLESKYGLTLDQYIKMHEYQKGKCGNTGCGADLDLKLPTTHVDHNHDTGEVRSLLCSNCNAALGFLKENEDKMLGLVKYVKKHNV